MKRPLIKVHMSSDGVLKLTDADGNKITGHSGISVDAPHGGMPTLTLTFVGHIKDGLTIGPLPAVCNILTAPVRVAEKAYQKIYRTDPLTEDILTRLESLAGKDKS